MNRSESQTLLATRRVEIQIDTGALTHNLKRVRQYCPDSRVFAVLKANAYGHGAIVCAETFAQSNCDGFAVVCPGEAEELRIAGITSPIIVLQGPHSACEARLMAHHHFWAVIHDMSQLVLLQEQRFSQPLQVWVKIDTGMGRMGIHVNQVPQVLRFIASHSQLECAGVMSHLACADMLDNQHTRQQIACFNAIEIPDINRSMANSAAILYWPSSHYDWVRPGIMLYGIDPTGGQNGSVNLQPAMQVSAPLTALKLHRAGDGIGYGQCYHCPEDMPVGYVGIGYGDGLPRALSGAKVVVNGHTANIIGRISMDSIALDLRGVAANVGDRVTLWGSENSVAVLADAAGTIAYELLCNIRGHRSYV